MIYIATVFLGDHPRYTIFDKPDMASALTYGKEIGFPCVRELPKGHRVEFLAYSEINVDQRIVRKGD
jgi:hypothetical protein